MNVKNCKKCGRIFNYISKEQKLCPGCMQELEDKFQEVKEYINDHKGVASLAIVAQECDVDINQIKQWVREERLELSGSIDGATGLYIECESCGKPITSGRFCDECNNKIRSGLIDAAGLNKKPEPVQKKERERERMRFLNRNDK